jgi:RimJ/RimL family protein N-acetyltransferase
MFQISERHDREATAAFMALPEIYWATHDRLAPQPEAVDWQHELSLPSVATFTATFKGNVIGYVQFTRRTSIGVEIHVAFRENFRGKVAKVMTLAAMATMFRDRGVLKVWGVVPADNRLAQLAAYHVGMKLEGTLTRAIVREEGGVRDLLIFGITKEQFLKGRRLNGATP